MKFHGKAIQDKFDRPISFDNGLPHNYNFVSFASKTARDEATVYVWKQGGNIIHCDKPSRGSVHFSDLEVFKVAFDHEFSSESIAMSFFASDNPSDALEKTVKSLCCEITMSNAKWRYDRERKDYPSDDLS